MITTGSKFFYALAAALLATGIVYGWSTGGDVIGPLSFGYKGGVGDLVGYTTLMAAGFLALFVGFATTAFRDADPEAEAEYLGVDTAPTPTAPGTSYWPVVGAFGVGLTVVGVALDSAFFVAGLLLLAAVAIEWTVQTWAERATGDPAVNREIRNRFMLPLEVPIAGFAGIALVIFGFSRLFLAISKENAVWAALAAAAVVFVVGTVLSTRPHLRTDLVAGLLAIAAVATLGIGIASSVAGQREFEHHGEEHGGEEDTESEGAGTDPEPEESENGPVEENN